MELTCLLKSLLGCFAGKGKGFRIIIMHACARKDYEQDIIITRWAHDPHAVKVNFTKIVLLNSCDEL